MMLLVLTVIHNKVHGFTPQAKVLRGGVYPISGVLGPALATLVSIIDRHAELVISIANLHATVNLPG